MNILIYDSGVGGKSVERVLLKHFDQYQLNDKVHLHYFADTANFPYGTKTESQLKEITHSNIERFRTQGFDLIAVACNTASAMIERYWEKLNEDVTLRTIIRPTVDVVNREPERFPNIFVIASQFTAEQHIYSEAINRVQPEIHFIEHAEQALIHHIEMGLEREYRVEVEKIVAEVPEGATLLWGCTHFSFIDHIFYKEMQKQGKHSTILDPAAELAKTVIREIEEVIG